MRVSTRPRTVRRHLVRIATLGAVALALAACNGPFGPATAGPPILGTLAPPVVDGVPADSATVTTRSVCSPVAVHVVVQINDNEHPAFVSIDAGPLAPPTPTAEIAVGGGTAELDALNECWRIVISYPDLGTTGDDLSYVITW